MRNPKQFAKDAKVVRQLDGWTRISVADRKIRKLFRDPRKFVRDAKLVRQLNHWAGASPAAEKQPKPPELPPLPPPVAAARPTAIAFGFPESTRAALSMQEHGHTIRFVDSVIALHTTRRIYGADLPAFVWAEALTEAVSEYFERHGVREDDYALVDHGPLRRCAAGATPASLVAWHPGAASAYETAVSSFGEADVSLARTLRQRLIDTRCSAYPAIPLDDDWRRHFEGSKPILVLGRQEERRPTRAIENRSLVARVQREFPAGHIVYRPHPEDLLRGTYDRGIGAIVPVLNNHVALPDLVPFVERVCVNGGLGGFEALVHGAQVTVLGDAFYSGHGLTDDRNRPPRSRQLSLDELVWCVYFESTRNSSASPRSPHAMIDDLIAQRSRVAARRTLGLEDAPRRRTAATLRIGPEWREAIEAMMPEFRFLHLERSDEPHLASTLRKLKGSHPDLHMVLWGYFEPSKLKQIVEDQDIPVLRFEDGFLRSVGIGAEKDAWGNTNLPTSIALDSRGIYFDRHRESDVEKLIREYPFDDDPWLLDRARAAMQRIRDEGLTKYNLTERQDLSDLVGPRTGRRVLVLGQVEKDASIRFGCSRTITNNDLVRIAARENPDAEILYKPHPVVLRGAADEGSNPRRVGGICRILYGDINLPDLFDYVDHVYVITSGAGFEALIKGLPVTTFGANFYAGWGLTDDRDGLERRRERRSLEEVFAAFYILYCRYYNHLLHAPLELEGALDYLCDERVRQRGVENAVKANRHQADGNMDAAKEALRAAVASNPRMPMWWQQLMDLELRDQQWTAVEHCAAQLAELLPDEPHWRIGRAMAWLHSGRPLQEVEDDLNEVARTGTPAVAQAANLYRFLLAEYYGTADADARFAVLEVTEEIALAHPRASMQYACAAIRRGWTAPAREIAEWLAHRQREFPLRLIALLGQEWAEELLQTTLATAVELDGARFLVDDRGASNLTAAQLGHAVFVGNQALGAKLLAQVLIHPEPALAKSVMIPEATFDTPGVAGWRELANRVAMNRQHASVIPLTSQREAARIGGRAPSVALVLATWLDANRELGRLDTTHFGQSLRRDEEEVVRKRLSVARARLSAR